MQSNLTPARTEQITKQLKREQEKVWEKKAQIIIHPRTLEQFVGQLSEKQTFDNSSINTFMRCRRLHLFENEWNLTTNEESPALTYGSAIHEALYHWYNGDGEDVSLKAFIKRCRTPGADIDLELDAEKGSKQRYSIQWGVWLLQKYFKENPIAEDPFETLTDQDGKPYLEVGFAVGAGEGIFVGRIDRIARYKETGELYVIDHKTTRSTINDRYWRQYNPNNQFTGYMWGVYELLGEMPVGCVVNVVRVYQFATLKEGENFDEKVFARTWIKPTFEQVQDRAKEIRETIIDMKAARTRGIHAFYRNAPVACGMWAGCTFQPVCSSRTADVAQLIAAGSYKTKHWFPYAALEGARRFEVKLAK